MDINAVGDVYKQLNKHNLASLETVYHQNVIFEDAAHRLEGWQNLVQYFTTLYTNVEHCQFDIKEQHQVGEDGFLTWTMELQHPKLKSGQLIRVKGVSHMKFQDGRVIYHRDYFDLGEMLYEHLPVLGKVIKVIKARLGQ
ncbi:nuclear transport factor 2 family protein [Vibrio olivae]|uniref:Nuclear transport factor 2 family protein n=1 Tax=Vibrio olivae TaxID=1243002 RepID=A0ABV5HJL8_9VIBR